MKYWVSSISTFSCLAFDILMCHENIHGTKMYKSYDIYSNLTIIKFFDQSTSETNFLANG